MSLIGPSRTFSPLALLPLRMGADVTRPMPLPASHRSRASLELLNSAKIQASIIINNALGDFALLVVCGLCKLSPQRKPIHVTHRRMLRPPPCQQHPPTMIVGPIVTRDWPPMPAAASSVSSETSLKTSSSVWSSSVVSLVLWPIDSPLFARRVVVVPG
jgi:hypothetical protein